MKPRVLMIAYACDPNGGGEHWLGWGWAQAAAQNYSVELITTPKARAAVEQASRELGIQPHFIEPAASVRKLTEAVGGSWWRKLSWQKRAAKLATELHRANPLQVVHQTTFHSFRVPFLAADLGIPSVWGPIAGGEQVPAGFERYLGSARYSEAARNIANRFWLNTAAVQRSCRKANVIFVSNRVTLRFLPPGCHERCRIVPPNALRSQDEQYEQPQPLAHQQQFEMLYIGNCVPTRAMPLVFEALHQGTLAKYRLSVVGDGPAIPAWKQRALELGLASRVNFVGKVPYERLAEFYASADVLVFPALRDSGGSALLEAMARFVPVICLDWAGPGEMVDSDSGIKIPVLNPEEAVTALASALALLQREPGRRAALATAARARALAFFRWQAKRELLEQTYQSLIKGE